ncbi:MAG: HK97 gp10 family phage protein [Bacillota bacterium]
MSASADISKLLQGLGKLREQKLAAASRGLSRYAAITVGESQELCPVKTGALQASGTWGEVERHGYTLTITIGHNTDYAAAVHERLDLHHEQGQAKYLETAIRQRAPGLAPYVAEEIKGGRP